MQNIQTALFDVDGVVVRPPKFFSDQYQEKFGFPNDAFLKEFFGGVFRECSVGKADLKEVLKKSLQAEWKWTGTTDEFLQFWFVAENYPDQELLAHVQKLRSDGMKCYLATNQEKYRTEYMRTEMGFDELFDGIFASCDVGYRKPDQEFYTHILRALRINPENVVYFDDEEKNVRTAIDLSIRGEVYRDREQIQKMSQ